MAACPEVKVHKKTMSARFFTSLFARSLSTTDNRFTFSRIADVRKEYYENLVINNPQNARFLTGWLNRVERCSQVIFE
ncbi:hypothetical protein U1D46_004295 [Cronobacter dublinensis]|nr:hypothetical protein [Cronobacter dublinensis]